MYQNSTILGDKGYLSINYQQDLFFSKQIRLEVPMRVNQPVYKNNLLSFAKQEKESKLYSHSYAINL